MPDRLASVLTIAQEIVDAIVAHARQDHPDEACGIVAGPVGSDRPERFVPMLNAARSPTFYEFDSGDLLRLYRDLDARDEEPVVVYHSHTATEAYPSRTDVAYASEPGAHYVLVSTREPRAGPRSGRTASWTAWSPRKKSGSCPRWTRRAARPEPHLHPERQQPLNVSRGDQQRWPSRSASRRSCARTPDGEKAVEGRGATLDELFADLDSRHPGLRERLVEDGQLRRFVNVYLNDEDVRFLGGLETALADGDDVTILPAVAGGELTDRALRLPARLGRPHPAGRAAAAVAVGRRAAVGQARGPQPDRLGQGPGGAGDDRGGRGRRLAAAGCDDPRADLRATPASRWRWRPGSRATR